MTTIAAENRGINGIYVRSGLQVPMIGCCVAYVRVRFSGNVSLVQMFIKPAVLYGLLLIICNCVNINSKSRINTQQNEKLVDIDTII